MSRWRKLGRIFLPAGQRPWMMSHAACPIALHLENGRHRVYFGTRDAQNHPRVGFVEIDIERPTEILAIAEQPALDLGAFGMFDENGVYPGTILAVGSQLRMYYCGRCNLDAPRYAMAIGMAESSDGGLSFLRNQQSPILDRNATEPWAVSTPCVVPDGAGYRMWYLAGTGWNAAGDKSYYDIRQARSQDGVTWQRDGCPQIPLGNGETNIASPALLRQDEVWYMWYCTFIGGEYRLGHARSSDGDVWIRCDAEAGISLSDSGWDSGGMAYPSIFTHKNRAYLLYSGNGYGRDGIGLAILED